jgi:RimJ/RimL family protein N-acetyltransferase
MNAVIETPRLVLREFSVDDAGFMLRLVNEPSWLKYIGDRKVYTLADAERYLTEGSIKSYHDKGFGFWKVELKSDGSAMASAGLAKRDYLDDVDLGFAFLPEFTRQGYALEAAEAIVLYAKEKLGLTRLVAFNTKDNTSSTRLLMKLGFQLEGSLMLEGEELNLYGKEL